jgi:hypothetical protein
MSRPSRRNTGWLPTSTSISASPRRLAGPAFAAQPQHLAALHARGNAHVQAAAVRQHQALRAAAHGVEKPDGQRIAPIGALAAHAGAAARAEQAGEDIAEIVLVAVETTAVVAPGRPLRVLAVAALTRRGAGWGAIMPVAVDFAAIEAGAAFGVGQQFVGRVDGLEAVLGLRVAGIEIGVRGLGELQERAANLLVRRVPGDAERRVGVVGHAVSTIACLPDCRSRSHQKIDRRRRAKAFAAGARFSSNVAHPIATSQSATARLAPAR